MSDIVIRGIEMPKDKQYSLTIFPDGKVIQHWEGVVFGETKAIELPPHGDLIDRRKLWEDTEGLGEYCHDRDFISLCDAIADAPTILEASNEN